MPGHPYHRWRVLEAEREEERDGRIRENWMTYRRMCRECKE